MITSNWVLQNCRFAAAKRMPKRPLGRTGHQVGIFSLGGQGSLESNPGAKCNIDIIRRAYELGVNYFDTSPIYGKHHASELAYGEALDGFRDKVFLASKTHNRSYSASMGLLESSLKRLRTDHIDLWQLHHLATPEELDQIFGDDGAMKALLKAQEEGMVRFLGITGHENPGVLIEAMRRHSFDVVLCPVNPADVHVKPSFSDELIPAARRRRMGVVGMKVFAQGFIFREGGVTTPWEALSYALSQPVSTVIAGVDSVAQLEENVAIAKSFEQLENKRIEEIEELAKSYPRRGAFFRDKFGGYSSKEELEKAWLLASCRFAKEKEEEQGQVSMSPAPGSTHRGKKCRVCGPDFETDISEGYAPSQKGEKYIHPYGHPKKKKKGGEPFPE